MLEKLFLCSFSAGPGIPTELLAEAEAEAAGGMSVSNMFLCCVFQKVGGTSQQLGCNSHIWLFVP